MCHISLKAHLLLVRVEQHGQVEAAAAAVDARGERGHVRLQVARHAQDLLGVALAGAGQLLRRGQQLLRIRVCVLGKMYELGTIALLYKTDKVYKCGENSRYLWY